MFLNMSFDVDDELLWGDQDLLADLFASWLRVWAMAFTWDPDFLHVRLLASALWFDAFWFLFTFQ